MATFSGRVAESGASFSKAGIGLKDYAPDVSFMQTLWHSQRLPEGTPVDPSRWAAAAMELAGRWNEQNPHDPYIPLLPTVDASAIREAIFNRGTDPEQPTDEWRKETQDLREPILKARKAFVEDIRKATSTTTASAFMHVITDEAVTYLYKRPYPVQALIPVEANPGKTASWDSIPPFGFGSAYFGVEDQDLTESEFQPKNRTAVIKYLYAVGRITKAAMLAGLAQYPSRDFMAIRVDAAQDAMRALRERCILGVDRNVAQTANTFKSAAANEYAGLYELLNNNVTAANQNFITSNGATYDQIMADLDTSFDAMVIDAIQPNLAVCDYKTFGIIRRALTEYFRTDPIKTFVQGVSKISLVFPNEDGLPLVPSPFLPMATGTNGCIFLLDTRLFARRTLWDATYEELAKVNTSHKFVISAAETLIDKSDVDGTTSLHGGVFSISI